MPEDQATFRTRIETTLTEIKTTLLWHARIGWGAIAIFSAIFVYFLTWYLPKELKGTEDSVTKSFQNEIGPMQVQLKNLSDNLQKFMSLRVGSYIPDSEKAKNTSPQQLSSNFRQTNLLIDAALRSQIPADPDLLAASRMNLRSILQDAKLPASVRDEGISTFGRIDTYAAFSKNAIGKTPTVTQAPSSKPVKAMFIATGPMTLAKFTAFDPTHQGIEFVDVPKDFNGNVVVYDVAVDGFKQNLGKVKWLNVEFRNSSLEYKNGPLNLENVTFQGCSFNFGTDDTSQKALAIINKAAGKPVTILSEFL
jgi:hypothetical protein